MRWLFGPLLSVRDYWANWQRLDELAVALDLSPADRHFAWLDRPARLPRKELILPRETIGAAIFLVTLTASEFTSGNQKHLVGTDQPSELV